MCGGRPWCGPSVDENFVPFRIVLVCRLIRFILGRCRFSGSGGTVSVKAVRPGVLLPGKVPLYPGSAQRGVLNQSGDRQTGPLRGRMGFWAVEAVIFWGSIGSFVCDGFQRRVVALRKVLRVESEFRPRYLCPIN